MRRLFCFGLGYSAEAVAQRVVTEGMAVAGTATVPAKADALSAGGYEILMFDGTRRSEPVASALGRATHVLLSIPPGPQGDPAFEFHAADIRSSLSINWIGYFSTIGVYGDTGGGWVDETTLPNPSSERASRRLASEMQWLRLGEETGKTVIIFRLPGIYGPGRNSLAEIRNGTARRIIKRGQVFNRVHVEDIASAVIAAFSTPQSRIFNVTDDMPSPPEDVIAFGAELLKLPCPPTVNVTDAGLSPMGRSFYSESKKVSNARMKEELGVRLKYPSYVEGLKALAGNLD